jgi:hypothetical protein
MKSTLEHMPPLDRTETPWTEAEMRIREALLAAETEAPADLEARVMEALDATPGVGHSSGRWVWGAALLTGAAMVGAMLLSDTDQATMQPQAVSEPLESVAASSSAEAVEATPMKEASQNDLENQEVTAVTEMPVSVQKSNDQAEVAQPLRMEQLEALGGREASEVSRLDVNPAGLQTDADKPRLERRPATLEVKQ